MDIRSYVQYRDRINLAQNEDDLRTVVKQFRSEAKGQDLKDLNKQAEIKRKSLEYIRTGHNRAQAMSVTYFK
jgi:hypothetical protein